MGQHTLRRPTGISTSTGRAIFTGAAALALVSGGTGMAFAGESSETSTGHEKEVEGDHDDEGDEGDDGGDHDEHHQEHEKHEACELPIYANLVEDVDAFDEDLTDDALKPANEASAELAKPVEDAVCPIVADELTGLDDDLGAGPEDDAEKLGTSPTGL